MFNYNLFYLLILISIPGILLTIPMLRSTYGTLKLRSDSERKLPSQKKFIILSIIQTTILVVIAADVGTLLMRYTGLTAPFLVSIANNAMSLNVLILQLIPAVIVGLGGIAAFLFAYYYFLYPHIDIETIDCMRKLRMSIGLLGRIFYGGIVEEILCRWGLMSVFVWLGVLICGQPDIYVMWTAILLSGILFGLGHIPAYIAFGCRSTPPFLLTILTLNLLASVIFGWLFWHNGLFAAMIAHALFHIVWYPVDLYSEKHAKS